jgi:ABC-type sulfate transport system permease component
MKKIFSRFLHDGYVIWFFIIPSAILLALFVLPLFAVFVRAIDDSFFIHAFSEQAFKALRLSLVTSSLTTLITILLGTPFAYILARWKFRLKSWVELFIDLPIVLPPSVAGLALLIAFGRRGLFGSALNVLGISLPFTSVAVVLARRPSLPRRFTYDPRVWDLRMSKSSWRRLRTWRGRISGSYFTKSCFRWQAAPCSAARS